METAMDIMIILGSKSDMPVAEKAVTILKEFGADYKLTIASAHRTPERVIKIAGRSGAKVFIAIAGMSAALPGFVAAHTHRPVIGVPVSGKVNLDSILSVTQMPPGVPVAAVGLDAGENAALLALQILAISDKDIAQKLASHRNTLKEKVLKDAGEIGDFDV